MWLQRSRAVGSASVTSDANSAFDINDAIDSTFDSKYVSNGTSTTFKIRIIANDTSNFVGIAGHNMFSQGVTDITLTTQNGETMSHTPTHDGVMGFRMGAAPNDWIDIAITKPSSNQITITHITLGEIGSIWRAGGDPSNTNFEPTTEQGGFIYEELNRHFKSRTSTNTLSAPTAFIRQSFAPTVKLNIPNQWLSSVTNPVDYYQWQKNFEFYSSNEGYAWFLVVDDPLSYEASERVLLCFDTKINAPKRQNHNSVLVDLSLSFKAYNGRLF